MLNLLQLLESLLGLSISPLLLVVVAEQPPHAVDDVAIHQHQAPEGLQIGQPTENR